MRTLAAVLLLAPLSARAEEMSQRLGIQPMIGHMTVYGDWLLGDCHDSFFSGGQSAGFRLNMGLTRWFSMVFTLQSGFWSVRRGHFVDTRPDPPSIQVCGELEPGAAGAQIGGYQRFVVTSLAPKASSKVNESANLYLMINLGIYHREIGLAWTEGAKEQTETLAQRYTGLALVFGMDLHLRKDLSANFEIGAHVFSDSYGADAAILAPHAGLTYWIQLGRGAR